MADRPTEKKETAKKDEAYQPLWDTDQSVPEYMTLLMGEQTQKNEDAELYEGSDDEELEHPDPDYEYVYPGAPKRYDSARKASEDEPEDSHDAEDTDDTDNIEEPEDTSEDTHGSRKDEEANHPVALASVEQAQQEQAQAMQTQQRTPTASTFGWNTSVCNRALFCRSSPTRSSAPPTQNSSKCAYWTAPTTSPHPCRRALPT